MRIMLSRYLLALALTLVSEGSIAYLFGLRKRQAVLAVAAINVMTNLILNYCLFLLGYLGVAVSFMLVVALEILVVVIEWRLLVYVFREPTERFLLLSIVANTASFLAGVLLFWI